MVSVISSTWMLVGGPGGPDRWHSQAGRRKRKSEIERQTEKRGRRVMERKCKSGRNGKMAERVTVVLTPAATTEKSLKPMGAIWCN